MFKRCYFVVFLVACLTSGAQSQRPIPSPDIAAEPKQGEPSKGQEKAAPQNQIAEQHPIIVNVLPPKKTQREIEEEQRERKDKSELDRRLVNLTEDLAIFTAVLALATIGLFGATAALWYHTRKLVKGAEDTAERQLRAYIL
jgi:hypothetical protein